MSEPTDRHEPYRFSVPDESAQGEQVRGESFEQVSDADDAGPVTDPAGSGPRPTRFTPAVGALVLAVSITSLLDDAGVIEVAWWFPFSVALVLGGLAVAALTVRQMMIPTIRVTNGETA